MRHFGMFLLLLPILWTAASIVADCSENWWANRKLTFVTGCILLGALAVLFFWAVQLAARLPYAIHVGQ
jgi:hypothetical protein